MRKHKLKTLGIIAVFVGVSVILGSDSAYAQTCPAVPNDGVDDDTVIQGCLDNGGVVSLAPGIYNIRFGLRLKVSGTIFTSSNPPARPRLVAHPDIMPDASMLTPILATVNDPINWEISYMSFDGNRFFRNNAWTCNGFHNPGGSNLIVRGSGFVIRFVESVQALCGSALEMHGDSYEVYGNTFTANGFAQGTYYPYTFADGLTAGRCDGGTIRNNEFVDNTDVDLVVFRGNGCNVRFNQIRHVNQYGFAGLGVGHQDASLSGATISDNTIESGYNLLSIGLALGHHPWNGGYHTWDIGNVVFNSVSGAVINILVEGVFGGNITNNSAWQRQGDRGYEGCGVYDNIVVGSQPGHRGGSLILQSWDREITSFDTGVCIP
jgi:hypothetical protein